MSRSTRESLPLNAVSSPMELSRMLFALPFEKRQAVLVGEIRTKNTVEGVRRAIHRCHWQRGTLVGHARPDVPDHPLGGVFERGELGRFTDRCGNSWSSEMPPGQPLPGPPMPAAN